MEGGAGGAVFDLVAAAGAGGGYEDVVGLLPYSREEGEFSDLHGDVVVFFGVSKGSGHTAASGGDEVGGVVGGDVEGSDGGVDAAGGFLVAVAVEFDEAIVAVKIFGGDVSGLVFAEDEFVDLERVFGDFFCGGFELGVGEF